MTPRKTSSAAAKKAFDKELQGQAEFDPNKSQFDDYKTDLGLESTGVWVDEIMPGLQVKLRHVGSPEVQKWRRVRALKQKGTIAATQGYLPFELEDKNKNDMLTQVVILGWRGPNAPTRLIDKTDEADPEGPKEWTPCTPENVLGELRTNRPMRDNCFLSCNSDVLFGVTPPEGLREVEKN